MSEFRILPPTRRAFASGAAVHITGADSVRESTETSRTDESIHGVQQHDPARPYVHVIHGAYREGTYIVTSPRMPQPVHQQAATREHEQQADAVAQPAWAQEADEGLEIAPQLVQAFEHR